MEVIYVFLLALKMWAAKWEFLCRGQMARTWRAPLELRVVSKWYLTIKWNFNHTATRNQILLIKPLGFGRGPRTSERNAAWQKLLFHSCEIWAENPVKLWPDFCSTETVRQYRYVVLYCLVFGNLLHSHKLI